jgi:hypothetical protein
VISAADDLYQTLRVAKHAVSVIPNSRLIEFAAGGHLHARARERSVACRGQLCQAGGGRGTHGGLKEESRGYSHATRGTTVAHRRHPLFAAVCRDDVLIAMQWDGYSPAFQTISELPAIDAPTRSLWLPPAVLYTILVTAFGWGVWTSACRSRAIRVVGALIVAYGTLGVVWPFAPMHLREVIAAGGSTLSDALHIILANVTVLSCWAPLASRRRHSGNGSACTPSRASESLSRLVR